MTRASRRMLLLVLVAATGCATTGGGGRTVRPADEPLGPETSLSAGEAAQAAYARGIEAAQRGDAARDAGKPDEARAEWTRAADAFLAAEKGGAAGWRLPLEYRAARLAWMAGDAARAADLAGGLARDPAADERSRAMGWHLAADALLELGKAQVRAGKLAPVKLTFAEERGTAPVTAQPIPGAWKAFVDAVDAYLEVSHAESSLSRPEPRPALSSPARLAVDAAKISFAFDDLPEARRRLEVVLARWPDDADAVAEAIPPYLQTFLVLGDTAGHRAAAVRLQQLLDGRAPDAQGKPVEGVARAQDELRKAVSGAALLAAQKLLDGGKPADAAQAFEAVAADPASPDAPNALHNAAIAWDRAGDPARAAAARERIVKDFPASRVAPSAVLTLAVYQARKGDHGAAARLYGDFVDRWPDHVNRCIAMQNVGAELDLVHRFADAAERYLAFGRDPACSRVDVGVAVGALRRARTLFEQVGKPARAKEAAAAADALARKPAKEKGT